MDLKYKSWQDITIEVYDRLRNLKCDLEYTTKQGFDTTEIEKSFELNVKLLSILCDVDEDTIGDLPLTEFSNLIAQTEFLKDMPKYTIETKYKIGDRDFDVQTNLRNLTTAQFIDFQTLVKDPDKNLSNLLACFMLPKGKKYGEDYDIMEIAEYLKKHMSIATARSIMFFFTLEYQALQKTILRYSIKDLKKQMKKEKNEETKKKLEEAIQQMIRLNNLMVVGDGGI